MTWGVLAGLVLAWTPVEPALPPPTPERWELAWKAPAGCPDAEAIRKQVAALVPTPSGGEGVLHVDARVEPRERAFVLTLRTTFFERLDEREVEARACDELAEAVALVVAISLDPSLDSTTQVPEPPDERERGPDDAAASAVPSEPRAGAEALPAATRPEPPAGAPSTSLRAGAPTRRALPSAWLLRLAPKLEVGTLPAVTGGLDLAVGVLWRWWRLELHGSHSWPRRVPGPGGSAGRFQLGVVGMHGCGRPRAGPVELPVCVGLDGGALRVDGNGLRRATTVHGPWLAASLGVGLVAGGTRVAFWTLVEGSAVLMWPRILVGEETFFRPFPVAVRGLAGLELRFAIESRRSGQPWRR